MEEAPVVVTAATGALGPVVEKLKTLVRRDGEYKLRRGTRKDIKRIRSKLKFIHSILWVIWEREDLDAEGKELRIEAWRLADDMNDASDDFILSLKRSNNGRRFIQEKIQPSPFQDLKRRAEDVWERCRKKWKKMDPSHITFSSLFSRTKTTVDSGPGKWRHRAVDPYVPKDISALVDMEEPRDELIKHLMVEEESTQQIKMASILGGAGMGKTTLARLVYEAIQDKFKARAFVSITSCHNMTEVLASIYQQVQGLPDSSTGTKAATAEKHLIDGISNFLKDKRYLVIIDGIWHYEEWEIIKKSLPENNLGSRIVTTSRVESITEKWRDDFDALVHKINHKRTLFFNTKMIDMNLDMVGEGFDHRHHIVEMCGYMPLALSCLFSALAKERERQEQQEGLCVLKTRDLQDRLEEQVKRNGIQSTPGFEPLVESLELGYKDLPHHMLKTCLLYCSIYPKRHVFGRDEMVRRWIAEGFVCKEEVAQDYYDELVSRRFITSFSLHPMMRNHLRWKLREGNFITCTSDGVPSSPIGRLFIDSLPSSDLVVSSESSDAVDPLSKIDCWQHIRSLVVFKDADRVPYKHLQHLRVLDVQCNHVLENQHLKDMCGLLRLRHLLVSGYLDGEGITEMPAEIARLQHLETLELHRTRITRLPAEIGDLKQLKTLDINCKQEVPEYGYFTRDEVLAELPREMGNLQHLETLIIHESEIGEQAWEIIRTLKKLKTLDISDNYNLSGIPRDIGELQQLKNIKLTRTGITELPREIGKLQQLKNLNLEGTRITELPKEIGKLQQLEKLDLFRTDITELPREIGNLQRLQILILTQVRTITKLPRDIGKLQNLEALYLSETTVKKIPREIGGLKKLKNLYAHLGTLPFEVGQLSKLKGLPKCVRQVWKNSDLVSSLAGEILYFSKEIPSFLEACESGDGKLVVGTKHMHIPLWIKEHFNNIEVLDIRICKLEEHDLKILREMPNLLELTLRFEGVPRKLVGISSGGFTMLRALYVDSRVPWITFHEGAMPSLWWLEFKFRFYGGPTNTDHPMGIKHLVRLGHVTFQCNEWYRGDSPCISATIDVVRKEASEHPNDIDFHVFLGFGIRKPKNFGAVEEISEDGSEACSSSEAEEIKESSDDGSETCSSSGAQEIKEIED